MIQDGFISVELSAIFINQVDFKVVIAETAKKRVPKGTLVSESEEKKMEFKIVLSRKDGKSFQKVIKDNEAEALLGKRLRETFSVSFVSDFLDC